MTSALTLALLSTATLADTGAPPPVASGVQVGSGQYDDAVAILQGGDYLCSGVLVGRSTVVTSALCAPDASHVIAGSKDWTSAQGELLPVASFQLHPLFFNEGFDLAILTLTRESSLEPRPIAAACALDLIEEGQTVTVAGFGALRPDEVDPNTRLNAADLTIESLSCEESDGCDPEAPVASEMLAGAEGAGPCVGDEGAPLYMSTEFGEVLLGISSRQANSAPQECGDLAIFTRMDAFRRWVEDEAQDELPFPTCPGSPVVTVDPFDPIPSGGQGRTSYTVTDPDQSDGFSLFFPDLPEHGRVDVLSGNRLLYRADRDFTGPDSFTFRVSDSEGNASVVTVDVEIIRPGFLGCGCRSTSTPMSWVLMGPLVVGLARRRRSRA